jgi:hypothetical protein
MMKNLIVSIILILVSFSVLKAEDTIRYDVMYFHATMRCEGCLIIEDYIKNSVNSHFEQQLKDSTLTLASIDFLQKANEHYQDDYKFDVQTLIVSKKVNGKEVKWKNLDLIWDNSNNFEKFDKYIKDEINSFINKSEELKDEY